MYEINPKFLHADGSINTEAAMAAGRKARTQAARQGFKAAWEIIHELIGHREKIANALRQQDASQKGAQV